MSDETPDLTPDELDHVLERYDQTDPALQRAIVGRIMCERVRLIDEVANLKERIKRLCGARAWQQGDDCD